MRIPSLLLGIALLTPAFLLKPTSAKAGPVQVMYVALIGQEPGGLKHRVKEDMRDTTDALGITPRVKGAIIQDSLLNDRRNHINVDTKDYVLHLTGHVYSRDLKARAGRIALRKLHEMHKNYKVSNELSISH